MKKGLKRLLPFVAVTALIMLFGVAAHETGSSGEKKCECVNATPIPAPAPMGNLCTTE